MARLIGEHISFDPKKFRAIVLYDVAVANGLPQAMGYQRVFRIATSYLGIDVQYDLNAMVEIRDGKPVCIYYVAYNTRFQRAEYCIGPMQVEEFAENVNTYFIGACNFFGVFGHPTKSDAYAAASGDAAMRGDIIGMVKNFGKSWLAALQDPEWWMSATAGTGAGYPTARSMATRMAQHERAYLRALRSRFSMQHKVKRSIRVSSKPEKFFHIIANQPDYAILGQIRKSGGLKLSTKRHSAHYGDGAYVFGPDVPRPSGQRYIEFEVPAGTAIELIEAPTGRFYRLVPPEGEIVPIKITGTNFTPDEIRMGDALAAD